jgi:hypothetical protein
MERQVKVENIDMEELVIALDNDFYELHYYLDLETGQVLMIPDEFRRELDEIYDEIYDDEGNRIVSLEDHLRERDDPDWQQELLLEADRIEQGYGRRYIAVEGREPYSDYNDMQRFIRTVADDRLRDHLWDAIQGRGAFRRFRDLLARHPDVEEAWFEFKDARLRGRVVAWLEANGIEPV